MDARLSLLLLSAACAMSRPDGRTTPGPTAPAPSTAVTSTIDQGTFNFLLNGKPAGEETFALAAGGDQRELRTKTTLRAGGDPRVTEGVLRTDAAYRALSGEFTQVMGAKAVRTSISRADDKLVLSTPGSPDVSERGDLFALNGVAAHFGVVCDIAGDTAKTVVAFPKLELSVGPVQEAKLEVGGRSIDMRLVPVSGAVTLEVYCDRKKPVLIDQPDVGFTAVREGYNDLLPLVLGGPTKPEVPPELDDLPRTVAAGDAQLACSFMVPKQRPRKPMPAVFFLTGSGPQDRDEDTVGRGGIKTAMFRHLAIALARAGIASLRCDDRGVGGSSTGDAAQVTLDTFASDALAMAAALRKEPGIDGARIGVIGHSEGGTVAPLVAARGGKLRALVLLASGGRPFEQISLEQKERLMREAGIPDADIQKELDHTRALYRAVRDGKPLPEDTRPAERAFFARGLPWLRSHLLHDPAAAARKVTVAVLVAQGGKDVQVSVKDAELLRGALAANKKASVKLYPELSHVFAPVKTGTLADYSDPDLQVDPGFISDVVAFLKKALGAA